MYLAMTEQHYLYDQETGTRIPVSKETKEAHNKMMQRLFHDASLKGMRGIKMPALIIGTGGDFDKGNYAELFDKLY